MSEIGVKIYGADRCHKSLYYMNWFKGRNIAFHFYDVEQNENFAKELRSFYENGKLNFPTIFIKNKKLRNPSEKDLEKWLLKKELS